MHGVCISVGISLKLTIASTESSGSTETAHLTLVVPWNGLLASLSG